MDKAAYLERRRLLLEGEARFKREKTCYKCHWIEEHCWCRLIEPFETGTRFVILMHPMEAKKEKAGTGRLCRAALVNSEIVVGIDFTLNERVNALIADPANLCMALYPGRKSLNVSEDDVTPLKDAQAAGRRLVVFLIDGTWQCAKKMMTLSRNVRALPWISFTAGHESIFEIKEQPAAYCLSTLESIHHFLGEAHRRGVEHLPAKPQDNLIVVFKAMIEFMKRCALDPSKSSYRGNKTGYTHRADRKKRGQSSSGRNIVLLE